MIKALMYLLVGGWIVVIGNNDMINFGFLLITMGCAEGMQAGYDFIQGK